MAQLAVSIVSYDEEFKRQVARLLRAGGVPVGIVEGRAEGASPEIDGKALLHKNCARCHSSIPESVGGPDLG